MKCLKTRLNNLFLDYTQCRSKKCIQCIYLLYYWEGAGFSNFEKACVLDKKILTKIQVI